MNSTTPASAVPGWYSDPHGQAPLRFFDGVEWTHHVAAAPATSGPAFTGTAAGFGSPSWAAQAPIGSSPADPVHWLLPTGRTWQSIAGGYVALFAIVLWFLGPVALGLGLWALSASSKGGAHGRGRAIFAIVVGAFATLGMLVFVASAL